MKTAREIVEAVRKAQKEIIGTIVVAPMISDSKIFVNIRGYNHSLRVKEKFYHFDFIVGLFLIESMSEVSFVRSCTAREQAEYLSRFPKRHIIVVDPENNIGIEFGTTAYVSYVPGEKRNIFDIILCRITGNYLIDCGLSNANDPAVSMVMRQSLLDNKPELERGRGITGYHRIAYKEIAASNEETESDKIRHALEYNGAGLVDYKYQGEDRYIIRYTVSGREFVSEIDKQNLQVISAGVCLDGTDSEFDLTSVVGVLRRGIDTEQI